MDLSSLRFVLKTRTTPEMVRTFVSAHCFCAVFLEWCIMMTADCETFSELALSLWMMTLSSSGKSTCHKTACQVLALRTTAYTEWKRVS